jgi:hypothetical protein
VHGVYKSDGVVCVLISYGSSAHGQGCVSAPEGEMSSSVQMCAVVTVTVIVCKYLYGHHCIALIMVH